MRIDINGKYLNNSIDLSLLPGKSRDLVPRQPLATLNLTETRTRVGFSVCTSIGLWELKRFLEFGKS